MRSLWFYLDWKQMMASFLRFLMLRIVSGKPTVVLRPERKLSIVRRCTSHELVCIGEGKPMPTVSWFRESVRPGEPDELLAGPQKADRELRLNTIITRDTELKCVAENQNGIQQDSRHFFAFGPPCD